MTYNSVDTMNGLEAVRKRPGMYVGSTTSIDGKNPRALIQIAQEILSNATDEAMNGYGDKVLMTIHKDNSMTVQDFGRGLPMGKDFDSAIRSMTVLHSSGKFNAKDYAKAGGLHGIGAKATNALSKWLVVDAIDSEQNNYHIKFSQTEVLEKKKKKATKKDQTGTTITFLPDTDVFDMIDWDLDSLKVRVDNQAYLNAGVEFILTDERLDSDNVFIYKHELGMSDLVTDFSDGSSFIGMKEPLRIIGSAEGSKEGTIDVELALSYIETIGSNVSSFANGIPTYEGGPHVDGLMQGIYKAFSEFAMDKKVMPKGKTSKLTANDTKDGLVAALSVDIPEDILQFESQTKEKLGTTKAKSVVLDLVYSELIKWLYDHVKQAVLIIGKMDDAKSAREAAVKARKDAKAMRGVKGSKDKLMLSTKLTPARLSDSKVTELLIVEGDSAGGSAKRARNSLNQAVLPLKGVPLNVLGQRMSKIMKNEEMATLINVMNAGVGSDFELDKIAYGKTIIMTDADDDGAHIQELLIAAFWTLMPDYIKAGHLYIANAPLFRFDKYVKGKREKAFALDDDEFNKMKKDHKGWNVTRLKGLGEMDPDDLKITTVEPGTRRLTQVKVDDVKHLVTQLDVFMGTTKQARDKRHDWIIKNVDFNNFED